MLMQTIAMDASPQESADAPAHISATRNGLAWPPNRGTEITPATLRNWGEQKPGNGRRPIPKDFKAVFSILGWRQCPWYYQTNWRVIGRWVNESGKEQLLELRSKVRRHPQTIRMAGMMTDNWRNEPQHPEWLKLWNDINLTWKEKMEARRS